LQNAGIPYRIVPDNAGAHLMSKGLVDLVITGADRVAANGDAANKIGTFEKAIVAKEFGIPFYIAAPFSTIDFTISDGSYITIEERSEVEVLSYTGPDSEGIMHTIDMAAPGSHAINPAFDVTPAKYITAFITERGVFTPQQLASYQERK
jgi:methylthioribose-1-phosphate isomerase